MNNNSKMLDLAAVLTLMLFAPVALGQSTYSTDVSVNQTASTTCSGGEAVTLSGSVHFTYSVTTDATTGINTYQVTAASNVSGVGQATQTSYAGSTTFAYGYPTISSSAQITAQLQYPLNSQGSAPSLMLNQTVNISVDTNGNISATLGSASTTCAQ